MNFKLLTSVLLASLFVLTSCSKRLAPSNGLVGEYLFKGNAKDNSSYHNNGQVHGAALVQGHNKKSKQSAYQFNGVDQFIIIPSVDVVVRPVGEHGYATTLAVGIMVPTRIGA